MDNNRWTVILARRSMTAYDATRFKDLRLYQKAQQVSRAVFKLTMSFHTEQMYKSRQMNTLLPDT